MAKRRRTRRGIGEHYAMQPYGKAKDNDDYVRQIQTSRRNVRESACEKKAGKGKICTVAKIAKFNGRLRTGCKKVPGVKHAYACTPKAIERGATDAPERMKKRSSTSKSSGTRKGGYCVKFKSGKKMCGFKSRASAGRMAKHSHAKVVKA